MCVCVQYESFTFLSWLYIALDWINAQFIGISNVVPQLEDLCPNNDHLTPTL